MIFKYNNIDSEIIRIISNQDSIFHYTKRSIAIENILNEGKLKFSRLSKTNDPHEYSDLKFTPSRWGNISKDDMQYSNAISKEVNNIIKNKSGFLSFCSNKYDPTDNISNYGCLKPRMWSQYGENHQGICLVFSKNKLLNQLKKNKHIPPHNLVYGKVEYAESLSESSDDMLVININDVRIFKKELIIDKVNQLKKSIFLEKHSDYQDECEYRIVVVNTLKQYNDFFINIRDCITAIILGDNFNSTYNTNIENFSKIYSIQYGKIHYEKCEYFLRKNL